MSNEPSLQNTGIPSTPTPTIVNGTPSTPATTMVVVLEALIITMARPIVNSQYLALTPFGSLGQSLGYNFQSIPMASIPFSYGMTNFTSHFSNVIPAAGPNANIGLGRTHLLILHFCLMVLKSLKRLLIWEAFLLLILGLIL
jgi:hypothetical protein